MAMISNDEINSIRKKANIVDIIGSYIPLTQRGRNYLCVCPFHDDHSPSMSVSEEKQIYKCFSCGNTGNVFTFVENYEGVSFIESVGIVAEKCGINIDKKSFKSTVKSTFEKEHEIMNLTEKYYQNNLKTEFGTTAMEYLKNRGIDETIIKEFGIGLSLDTPDSLVKLFKSKKYDLEKLESIGLLNKNNDTYYDTFTRRITFPLWDKDGNIIGFSARIYRNEKDTSKYVNSRESKLFKKGETLYNYHHARDMAKKEKSIIVVEGFMDAIRLAIEGVKNVVALQGTAMTKDQINLLKKLHVRVILCLDNDQAGELATNNNGEQLVNEGIETYVIRLTGEKDPDEYVLKNGIESFLQNLRNPLTYFDFKMNYLKKNKDLNKSVDLADYINNVLKELSTSKDDILKEITIKKMSKKYNLSIDVLKNKLLEFKPIEKKEVITPIKKDNNKKDAYTMNAEKIIYYMLNGKEYIDEYQKVLGFFEDALDRNIANEIIYYYRENKMINPADFITYINDKEEIKEKVLKIVSDVDESVLSIESMDDYLKRLDKIMIKNEIKRLKEQIKEEKDENKKIELLNRIAEIKKNVEE